MGIGVSLSFIAIGAILAFALQVDLSGINIQMVGWILMLVGLISMGFTLTYTRPRRRADLLTGSDPAYVEAKEAAGPDTFVREERVVERTVDRPAENVERVIERPVRPESAADQSPRSHAQDPEIAQDPVRQNTPSRRRSPFRR